MAEAWDKNQDSWLPSYLRNGANTLASQQRFAGELEPQRQSFINRFLSKNDPGNTEARIARQSRINTGIAGDTAGAQDALLRSRGLSTGYRGGNIARNVNAARGATTDFANQQYSPEGQSANLAALLGAIGQGQSQPGLAPMLQAQSSWTDIWRSLQDIKARNEAQGGMFGGLLGNVLGQVVPGLDFRSLFGGGGGRGGNPSLSQGYPTSYRDDPDNLRY